VSYHDTKSSAGFAAAEMSGGGRRIDLGHVRSRDGASRNRSPPRPLARDLAGL